ncbi:MAG TPA: hypothetical protein VJV79_31425 [Polyangiaceae bacterium]|nr:hypothetical protein [Polyangiaceae bacterium]
MVLRNTKQGRNDANLQKLADHLDKLILRDPTGPRSRWRRPVLRQGKYSGKRRHVACATILE